SHAAYLRATEVALQGLAAMAGVSLPGVGAQAQSQTWAPAPMPMPMPVVEPMPVAAAPMPVAAPMPGAAPMPAPVIAPTPVVEAAPVPAPAPAKPSVDLEALMLRVVAEKTGYPESMLELSMDMEAELGIDSIKRVEILAAVQEQAPGLPEIDAGHMGTLRDREGTGLNSSRLQGP